LLGDERLTPADFRGKLVGYACVLLFSLVSALFLKDLMDDTQHKKQVFRNVKSKP